ncbi:MAG: hypothetical protein ABI668_14405 [Sphingorhabdus sp.]
MTKLLALEWVRFDIVVNAITPSYLDTNLNSEFWDTEGGKAMLRRIPQRSLGSLADLTAESASLCRANCPAVLTIARS